jgi:hypothetical protein
MRSGDYTPVAHAFNRFSNLFLSDGELEIETNDSEPYAVAAKKGDTVCALISSYRKPADSFNLEIPGKKIKIFGLSDGGFGYLKEAEGSVRLPLSKYTVYYIEAE